MKSEILVLRARAQAPNGNGGFPAGGERSISRSPIQVEHVREDVREIHSIREDVGVLAAAEVIRLKHHGPVDRCVTGAATGLWGLSAVGIESTIRTGDGAVVAILDTGIDRTHSAFSRFDSTRLIETDFSGDGNGDQDGHGTHCAGTVFGGYVGEAAIGVAPGVSKALVAKVFGAEGGTSSALADGIDWALRNGANIVSMSCGFDYPGMVEDLITKKHLPTRIAAARALEAYCDTRDFFEAIAKRAQVEPIELDPEGRRIRGQPVVFIAAAGNGSDWHRNCTHVVSVEPPASAKGFLSVGALGLHTSGRYFVAGFSNRGARISAPGENIASAAANVVDGLTTMSGTSMATPHVAGIAALWFEEIKARRGQVESGMELMDAIVSSASDVEIEDDRLKDAGRGLVKAPRARI